MNLISLVTKNRDFLFLTFTLIADRLLGFVIVFYLIRLVAEDLFAFWTQLNFLPGVLCGVIALGLGNGILRLFIDNKISKKIISKIINIISFLFLLLTSLTYISIVTFASSDAQIFLGGTSATDKGILILFFLIYLFNYVKSRIEIKKNNKDIFKFIDSKKIISIALIPIMVVLFALGIYNWYSIGMSSNFASSFYYVNEVFYTTFFSILIIADVFILLLSFLYTERYSQIMRNTGFIICTILIRLSFSSTGLTNLLLIVSSVIFGLLILKIYSLMNRIE